MNTNRITSAKVQQSFQQKGITSRRQGGAAASNSLVSVDLAMKRANEKETLQYFSNISDVRDQCTKEQLGEFVELMNHKGANSIVQKIESERVSREN